MLLISTLSTLLVVYTISYITPGDRIGGNQNALNNRQTRIKNLRNIVFNCHFSPIGRQMAIENSVSNDFEPSL